MANALYDKGRQKFLEGSVHWLTDDIKAVLVDTASYTVDLANDEFLDDIPAGEQIAHSPNFTTKTSLAGIADAANLTFTTVSGDPCEALVIYKDTGNIATSPVLAYIDTVTSGLPVTPSGGDVTVTWDDGANKIFKL